MQEERDSLKAFLDHFEQEVLPVFISYGYTRELALQIYSTYCFSAVVVSPPDENEAWKE